MSEPLPVEWEKDCPFDVSSLHLLEGISGVCLIYEKGTEIENVYIVDRGNLAERMKEDLENEELISSLPQRLHVKYAEVSKEKQYGVELFLINYYGVSADAIEVEPLPFPFNPDDYKVYGLR